MVTTPITLVSGQSIAAADLNTNFSSLAAAATNIANSSLAPNAGITADKLADRFAICDVVIPIVAATSGSNLGSMAEFSVPTAAYPSNVVLRHRITLRSGQEAYLCEVEFYVHDQTIATTANPTLALYVQGTLIGAAAVTITSDENYWRLRNANPIDSPLLALADGDVFEYAIGRSDTSGTPTIAGVNVRLKFKVRVCS